MTDPDASTNWNENNPPPKLNPTVAELGSAITFRAYQREAHKTASYPARYDVIYPLIGVASEAGEILEKLKKRMRTGDPLIDKAFIADLALELGDVLWYISEAANSLGLNLETIAANTLKKLASRAERGLIHGSGDHR